MEGNKRLTKDQPAYCLFDFITSLEKKSATICRAFLVERRRDGSVFTLKNIQKTAKQKAFSKGTTIAQAMRV